MSLPVGARMPSFEGAVGWLNRSLSLSALDGRYTIFKFWSLSCPACMMNMYCLPRLKADYGDELMIVLVHRPRFDNDRDSDLVNEALERSSVTEPCAIDNNGEIGRCFEVPDIWPYYYLFDQKKRMRLRGPGASGLNLVEESLRRQLSRSMSTASLNIGS